MKNILEKGFYFSYNLDLTSSFQRDKINSLNNPTYLAIDNANMKYFWNYSLCSEILNIQYGKKWIVPLIQGYVSIKSFDKTSFKIKICLISRRRHTMAGTRFNARGIDDSGNAANFVETELIIEYESQIFSWVILRGSVPLFWTQKGIIPKIELTRTPEMSYYSFKKHYYEFFKNYDKVISIDLLNQKKADEEMLSKSFEQLIKNFNEDASNKPHILDLLNFNIAIELKQNEKKAKKDLIQLISNYINLQSFFRIMLGAKELNKQDSVIRVNCLDCLDRTNIIQNLISWKVFKNMCKDLLKDEFTHFNFNIFKSDFNSMWADNGDILSIQYCGTESTTSEHTRRGKSKFTDNINEKMVSVQRFFEKNFFDGDKQNAIDILLGRNLESNKCKIHELKGKIIFQASNLYVSNSELNILIVTWNIENCENIESQDFKKIFNFQRPYKQYDLIIIGMQNVMNQKLKNDSKNELEQKYDKMIGDELHIELKFIKIAESCLQGIILYVYGNRHYEKYFTQIEVCKIQHLKHNSRNSYGAVLARFNIHDTFFTFANCDLPGKDSNDKYQLFMNIYEKCNEAPWSNKFNGYNFCKNFHKTLFIIGDLNFKINLEQSIIQAYIDKNQIYLLFEKDLFHIFCNETNQRINENPINFKPTSLYNKQNGTYLISKPPGWRDRIVYQKSKNLKCNYYAPLGILKSRHLPLIGEFICSITTIASPPKENNELSISEEFSSNEKVIVNFSPIFEDTSFKKYNKKEMKEKEPYSINKLKKVQKNFLDVNENNNSFSIDLIESKDIDSIISENEDKSEEKINAKNETAITYEKKFNEFKEIVDYFK